MIKTLSIDLAKEYRLRIEEKDDLAQSFFSDIYKQTFEQVKGIVKWTKEFKESCNNSDFKRERREYNNIIAFTGERGTGKSSAMLTIANALIASNISPIVIGSDKDDKFEYGTLFETLNTIDPSRFEKDQNVIEVIIAELFEKFQQRLKNESNKKNDTEKRNVLKAFQEVYKCLKTISPSIDTNKDKYEGDALETLAKLADATKMEDNMRNLIRLYLQYLNPKQAENASILIIPIDDFDLNVSHAGLMAEQIRKYLMIPQVLVLMAVNMDQFGDVKTQEVIGDFTILMTKSNMSESPRDVAARYILKLLPIERRIIIPSIRIERNNVELIVGYNLETKEKKIFIGKNENYRLELQIFNYIYECTGLYLVSRKDEYHTFLPNTLREFITLCSLLGRFEKPSGDNIDSQKLNNLKIFEDYLLNTWIKDYLLIPFQKMILNSSTLAYSAWNKFFITSIVEILSKEIAYNSDWSADKDEKQRIYKENDEIISIINRNNYAPNVSLGDLIYFLSFLNQIYINDNEIKRLVFSLNCWYSIKMNAIHLYYQIEKLAGNNEVKCAEIKDIVNGTIVNKEMELIRNSTSKDNRIQFRFSLDDNYLDTNIFLTHNILIKHDTNYSKYKNYRTKEDLVYKEIFTEKFSNPTFNLFAFVYKDIENIFPLPYNNLELWNTIVGKINRDYKEEASITVLITNLFKQIFDILFDYSLSDNFKNNNIIKLFLDEAGNSKYLKKQMIPEVEEIYNNQSQGNKENITELLKYLSVNRDVSKRQLVKKSKEKCNENEDIVKFIEGQIIGLELITKEKRKEMYNEVKIKYE